MIKITFTKEDLEQQVYEAIAMAKKGAFTNITYKSEKKSAIKGHKIEKITSAIVRLGIEYKNLGVNKGIETGALKWGQWRKDYYTYIIDHKDKSYLRVYTTDHIPTSKWFLDGEETTKEELIANGYYKEEPSNPMTCYVINFDNLITIG